MTNHYQISRRTPTPEEYKALCAAVDWADYMNLEVAEDSLQQSVFAVVAQLGEEIVGMGRIVGDGKIYFYIQDIAVAPEHQGKGVGSMIMDEITEFLKENAPEKAFIGLFASQGRETFYRRYGLHNHDGMTGMFGVMHRREIK